VVKVFYVSGVRTRHIFFFIHSRYPLHHWAPLFVVAALLSILPF
jgi:hypothetical protein